MGLTLLAGPANAGKVALLLERYLARLDDEPTLIVPNASDVDRVERDLLARCGCLFSGSIGTFDDLFGRLVRERPGAAARRDRRAARADRAARARGGLAERARALGAHRRLRRHAAATLGELESGLLDPARSRRRPGAALRARTAPSSTGWGSGIATCCADAPPSGSQSELDAWHGEPVFAYGFEDLTGAEWALLEALAGRTEVEVSLPYEPGRVAFASLRRTAEDLAALADGRIEELPPRSADTRIPRSRISSARSSRSRRRRRRSSTRPSASSRAPARAARSSSSATSCSR